jgi:cephalosporin-C deacetylase
MQSDFNEYWETAKAQLPELVEGETVILQEIKSRSSATHKIYRVEMQSVPNSIDGEPVIVRGFFVEPQDGKKHPVLMHFFGWDDRGGSVTVPSGGNGDYTEFYLSTRGQYNNNRAASYEKTDALWLEEYGEWYAADPCKYASIMKPGDEYNWFGFNFGDLNGFYYRGAFLDTVQAVRFMASRSTSDMNNLFAEGSSQGGALSYACAALSDYPFTAIAPNVAFLGDYPDYFQIASWPGNVAKENKGTMTDEEMYAFLSYFDTKNLATRISCAVHASSGLKDGTCPPHTNFAPFNNLNTDDKVMIVDPKMGHSFPAGWESKWKAFFKERMK